MGKDTLTISPPEGFVLDKIPAPPEGFVLDSAPEPNQTAPSLLSDFDPEALFDAAKNTVDLALKDGISVTDADFLMSPAGSGMTQREMKIQRLELEIKKLPSWQYGLLMGMYQADPFRLREYGLRHLGKYLTRSEPDFFPMLYEAIDRTQAKESLLDWKKYPGMAGQIGKVVTEFAALPEAKGISAVARNFALQSALQAPSAQEEQQSLLKTVKERAVGAAKSAAVGVGVGVVGKFIPNPLYRIPTVTGGFMTLTALEGGDREQILESGITVLGFEAVGFAQRRLFSEATKAAREFNPKLKQVRPEDLEAKIKEITEAVKPVVETKPTTKPTIVSDEEYAAIKARQQTRQKSPSVAQGEETPPGAAVTTPGKTSSRIEQVMGYNIPTEEWGIQIHADGRVTLTRQYESEGYGGRRPRQIMELSKEDATRYKDAEKLPNKERYAIQKPITDKAIAVAKAIGESAVTTPQRAEGAVEKKAAEKQPALAKIEKPEKPAAKVEFKRIPASKVPTTKGATYRGEKFEGNKGVWRLGKGLYSTPDKALAGKYGDVTGIVGGLPDNPLIVPRTQSFEDVLLEMSGEKTIREFNKKYADPSDFLKPLGYDGVISESSDVIVKYPPPTLTKPAEGAVEKIPTPIKIKEGQLPINRLGLLEPDLPPVKEGYVRLYRGQHPKQKDLFHPKRGLLSQEEIQKQYPRGKGGWFSDSLEYAYKYAQAQGEGWEIVYIDVPAETAKEHAHKGFAGIEPEYFFPELYEESAEGAVEKQPLVMSKQEYNDLFKQAKSLSEDDVHALMRESLNPNEYQMYLEDRVAAQSPDKPNAEAAERALKQEMAVLGSDRGYVYNQKTADWQRLPAKITTLWEKYGKKTYDEYVKEGTLITPAEGAVEKKAAEQVRPMTRDEYLESKGLNPHRWYNSEMTAEEIMETPEWQADTEYERLVKAGKTPTVSPVIAAEAPAPEGKAEKPKPDTGKLPGGRQAGGTILLSPQEWADALKAGYYHLQKGATTIADWTTKMLADFGDPIKPHLSGIWNEIHGVDKGERPTVISTKASQAIEDVGALIEDIEKPPIVPPREKAVPPKGEKRERGFVTSVKEEFPDLESRVAGEYVPRSTDRLSMKAHTLILDDIDTAERMARTGANDEAVATASELIKHYNEKAQTATDEASKNAFYDKAADIANTVAPTLTELGRAVQAASILSRITPEGQLRFAAQAISKYNEEVETTRGGLFGLRKKIPGLTGEQSKDILTRMKKVQDMPDGPEKAMAFWELQQEISMLIPSTWYNKIVNLWKAGLLTGIKTSGLNTIANLSHGVSEIVKDIPTVGVDKTASLFTKERKAAFTLRGLTGGVVEGFQKGWRYLATGYDARQVGAKFDFKKVNFGKSRFAKWAQAYEEAVFGLLGAEDQPPYYGAKARSLFSQAIAQAKTQRLKGAEAVKFINDLLEKPTNEMLKYAMIDAETSVFVNRTLLGDAAKMLQRVPGVEFVIPFARTPSAIAMQIVNYSPVGAVKTVIENIGKGRFDQRLFSQGMGRAITGTAALAVGSALFKAGLLSLGRPKSEREKKLWELEGRKENAILVDGKWRSAQILGPIGNVLVIGGYFAKGLTDTGSPTQAILQAISGGAKSFTEETYLSGLRRTLDVMEDPAHSFELWFSSLAGSFVPTIVADVARAGDSTERRTVGPIQRIEGRIPGLRNTLPPRIDVFGQDLPRYGGNVLEVMIDPTRPVKVNHDVVIDELRRLWDNGVQSSPTLLGDKAGYKELTEDQNTRLWRRAGVLTYQAIFTRMHTPEYKKGYSPEFSAKINDAIRGQVIETVTRQAQNQARWEMVKELESQGMSMDYLKTTDLFPIPIGEIPLMIMQEGGF